MITVLLPSRGRPEGAKAAIESFDETKSMFDTNIQLILSMDDPKISEYFFIDNVHHWGTVSRSSNTLTKKLNETVEGLFWAVDKGIIDKPDIVGFIADDNRFRTDTWDAYINQALNKPGIAYGNDLYQGECLPTSWFVSYDIVKALGWFALPVCDHLYLDNAWKLLGERLGRITYLPDVVIEHMHPVAGKGAWDEGYIANHDERYSKDKEAFLNWVVDGLDKDVQRVNEALNG